MSEIFQGWRKWTVVGALSATALSGSIIISHNVGQASGKTSCAASAQPGSPDKMNTFTLSPRELDEFSRVESSSTQTQAASELAHIDPGLVSAIEQPGSKIVDVEIDTETSPHLRGQVPYQPRPDLLGEAHELIAGLDWAVTDDQSLIGGNESVHGSGGPVVRAEITLESIVCS